MLPVETKEALVTVTVAIALLAYLVRATNKESATTAQVTHAARGRLAPR